MDRKKVEHLFKKKKKNYFKKTVELVYLHMVGVKLHTHHAPDPTCGIKLDLELLLVKSSIHGKEGE